jgi:hypothetical protein
MGETYVVSLAACSLSELVRVTELCVERLDLLLCACVLPVGAEGVAESTLPLALCAALELLEQRLACIEVGEQVLSIMAPEDGSMLHARTRDTLDF